MNERQLGPSGLRVPAIGFGCMGLSEVYGPVDDNASLEVLQRAYDLGVRLFDTADQYGDGHNERLLARFLADRRAQVVLATKFGIVAPGRSPNARPIRNDPGYIRAACDASLQRLGTDYIDLYYLHRLDPEVPIEESVGAMSRLVEAGKVRHLGLSEVSSATLRRAAAVHPIAAVQSEYSLWTRDVEPHVLPACRELGTALVAFSPLGRGFLSGRIRSHADLAAGDRRHENPRFQPSSLAANLRLVDAVRALADARGVTAARMALAWVLDRGDDIVPIPGTKRARYLDDNVEAARIELTDAERAELAGLFADGAVSGHRYGEVAMRWVGTDTD